MTKEDLKELSDNTFTSNNTKHITAESHRNFNEHLIDNMVSQDDFDSYEIPDGSVTEDKLAGLSISEEKIQSGVVTQTKLADESVSTAKLQDAAVSTTKLQDAAITPNKLSFTPGIPAGYSFFAINIEAGNTATTFASVVIGPKWLTDLSLGTVWVNYTNPSERSTFSQHSSDTCDITNKITFSAANIQKFLSAPFIAVTDTGEISKSLVNFAYRIDTSANTLNVTRYNTESITRYVGSAIVFGIISSE